MNLFIIHKSVNWISPVNWFVSCAVLEKKYFANSSRMKQHLKSYIELNSLICAPKT